jgi:hypothetical protein
MSFVAPLFLLGLGLIALPLWLHRLQTQSSERKPFSSAMLLETAEERIHVRKKLKYLLLLAARIALLVLLVIAFARPFIEAPPDVVTATDAGTHVILVDTSASMGRAGVFSQALNEARRAIDDAPGDAVLQVLSADATINVLGTLTNDKGTARGLLGGLTASAVRMDYGDVMTGVERIAAAIPPPVTLHFVSDYQASAMPVRFSDVIPAGVTTLIPRVVGTGDPFNWSFEFVRDSADGIEVGLNGAGDRERIGDIEFSLNGNVMETRGLSQTGPHVVHFDVPDYEPGVNRVEFRIDTDDDMLMDNRWYHVVDNQPPAPIPLLTIAAGGLPVTYLSAALESAGDFVVEPLIAGEFDARVLSRYRWAIVDDLGFLDPQLADALTAYVEGGGNLLAFAGARAAALEVLPVSGHRPTTASVQGSEFLAIGQIDSRHPVLTQTDGWQGVTVTRSLPLAAMDGDEVLIRLDNGDPFLIERRIGQGRLLLMPTHLDNQWSDLPVRPVFVSFMIEAAGYLSGINEIERTYTVGASLPLGLAGTASGQVVDPDGETVLSLADTTREQQIKLNKPGFYEVYTPGTETVVAANIDPRESNLARIGQDVLDRWKDSTDGQPASGGASFEAEATRTIELWHWVLLILAFIVIGESILGNMHLTPRRMENA